MKNFLLSLAVSLLAVSDLAVAGCHDKCIIRNPFSGNCAYEVQVCPLSTETIGRWLNGASKVDIEDAFARIDPTVALKFYVDKLRIDAAVDDALVSCFVHTAALGTLGTACAAGVAEIGPLCLSDFTCTATCVGTGQAFSNIIKRCGGN